MYPEYPWATGKKCANTYKHTKAHQSTPKHTKAHHKVASSWSKKAPIYPMPCHFVHPILSCIYIYFFRVSPTDSGIENTATNISELYAGTNLQDDTHRASPATWPLCSALWRSQHLRSSQFISSGQSRGSLGSQGPSGCRCSARDSMMWHIKRHRSIDLMRLKHSEFSLDGRKCIGLYWMAMYYMYWCAFRACAHFVAELCPQQPATAARYGAHLISPFPGRVLDFQKKLSGPGFWSRRRTIWIKFMFLESSRHLFNYLRQARRP